MNNSKNSPICLHNKWAFSTLRLKFEIKFENDYKTRQSKMTDGQKLTSFVNEVSTCVFKLLRSNNIKCYLANLIDTGSGKHAEGEGAERLEVEFENGMTIKELETYFVDNFDDCTGYDFRFSFDASKVYDGKVEIRYSENSDEKFIPEVFLGTNPDVKAKNDKIYNKLVKTNAEIEYVSIKFMDLGTMTTERPKRIPKSADIGHITKLMENEAKRSTSHNIYVFKTDDIQIQYEMDDGKLEMPPTIILFAKDEKPVSDDDSDDSEERRRVEKFNNRPKKGEIRITYNVGGAKTAKGVAVDHKVRFIFSSQKAMDEYHNETVSEQAKPYKIWLYKHHRKEKLDVDSFDLDSEGEWESPENEDPIRIKESYKKEKTYEQAVDDIIAQIKQHKFATKPSDYFIQRAKQVLMKQSNFNVVMEKHIQLGEHRYGTPLVLKLETDGTVIVSDVVDSNNTVTYTTLTKYFT